MSPIKIHYKIQPKHDLKYAEESTSYSNIGRYFYSRQPMVAKINGQAQVKQTHDKTHDLAKWRCCDLVVHQQNVNAVLQCTVRKSQKRRSERTQQRTDCLHNHNDYIATKLTAQNGGVQKKADQENAILDPQKWREEPTGNKNTVLTCEKLQLTKAF